MAIDIIESGYSESVGIEHRKKFAQFFTPVAIADIMVDWLLGCESLTSVLEPAFGLGVFSRILLSKAENVNVLGYDTDPVIYEYYHNKVSDGGVDFLLDDYINCDWNMKFDGIICNPPYFKFHDYDNKKYITAIRENLGFRLRMHTNLYAVFLLKSISQLAAGGRCAYIIPSEFLNSDYGVQVKKYLLESGTLRHIIVFNFKENVFDDATTTSAIILCANDKQSHSVGFTKINTSAEIGKINRLIDSYPSMENADSVLTVDNIDPSVKWKNYYSSFETPKLKHLVPFGTYAKVMRGIATGANEYFSFNLSKARQLGIDCRHFKPCICHSSDVSGILFSDSDYSDALNADKDVMIFNPLDLNDAHVVEYIRFGEDTDINKRFLTSKRNPWYGMENRMPAPIWVGVFNRSGLKFVRNETNTLNLTTFHCIYVQENLFGVDADLLFTYLISNCAKNLFSASAREYGNGLSKFEPNDLNKANMVDLGILDESCKNQLRELYRNNKRNADSSFIKKVDDILFDAFS